MEEVDIMSDSFNLCSRMDDAEGKCLSCGAPLPVGREGQRKFTGGQMGILVLSDGTQVSKDLYINAVEAVKSIGKEIRCEEILDNEIIESFHIRKYPALVINGSIVSQGIVSSVEDIIGEIEYMY
jgi:hypothetical protein